MRRTARENAFKLIFERSVSGGTGNISYAVLTHALSEDEKSYFDLIVNTVTSNQQLLTDVIAMYAHGYDIDRIYKIDLSILLISASEILFIEDVPDKVAVNEALELSKIYSTDNSPSFINGILASVIRNKEDILSELENN